MEHVEDEQQAYDELPTHRPWPAQPYPHSHHGTPAREYDFTWSQPAPGYDAQYAVTPHQRSQHEMLQPLILPQWPSMLGSQTYSGVGNLGQHVVPSTLPPLPSMHGSTALPEPTTAPSAVPRRTLTDEDRRNMCLYSESNPNLKQTDIGRFFGVDRSTVSKVLRQREKYMARDKRTRPTPKRDKNGKADVERSLSNWAKKQQQKGQALSDDDLRDQANKMALVYGPHVATQVTAQAWLQMFRQRHLTSGARKGSNDDTTIKSDSPSADEAATASAEDELSPLVASLSAMKSEESLLASSPEDAPKSANLPERRLPHSFTSLATVASEQSAAFSSETFLQSTAYYAQASPPLTSAPGPGSTSPPLPRRHTEPILEQYSSFLEGSTDGSTPRFSRSSDLLDSPMMGGYAAETSPDLASSSEPPDTEQSLSRTVSPSDTLVHSPHPLALRWDHNNKNDAPSIESRLAESSIDSSTHNTVPSRDEALHALRLVIRFFEQQPTSALDMADSMAMGRLMEKLKMGGSRSPSS